MVSNDSLPIQVKAGRDGFTLVPHPSASFDSIMDYMRRRLSESRDFFHRSNMILDLRTRHLGSDEIQALNNLLVELSEAGLIEVKISDDLSMSVHGSQHKRAGSPSSSIPSPVEACPVIVRSTCRSGARVVSTSDCVILGDVNPGAEVIAAGDIIVFGSLRGVAHAGATGNRSARIWALSIEPNQLRIADLVAVPPRGSKPTPKRYEIAEITEDAIGVTTV